MSKDQKKTNGYIVENLENLKTTCKILMEIESMIEFWKMEKVWPINLAMDGIRKCVDTLNGIILSNNIDKKVSVSHIMDK